MERRLLIQKNNKQTVRSIIYQQIYKTFNTFIIICWIDVREPWHNSSHEYIIPEMKQTEPHDMVDIRPGEYTLLQAGNWSPNLLVYNPNLILRVLERKSAG